MTIKLSFDEIADIIRSYQFEQECIMDSLDADEVLSYRYISASSKHDAASQIRNMIFDKFKEKIQVQREKRYSDEKQCY